MKTAQQDLTQGPLEKQIMLFSIPLVLSNVLQVLFNMADVAVVGRFAGPIALGAVGSTTILVPTPRKVRMKSATRPICRSLPRKPL